MNIAEQIAALEIVIRKMRMRGDHVNASYVQNVVQTLKTQVVLNVLTSG